MNLSRRALMAGLAAMAAPGAAMATPQTHAFLNAADPTHRDRLRAVTDRVMGGVSEAQLSMAEVDGAMAWHLRGAVSLENNGGFIQLAADAPGAPADWSAYRGLRLELRGDGGAWFVSVRTTQVRAPWQSFRAPLPAARAWRTVDLPWQAFAPHRIRVAPDWRSILRLGILAVGEARPVDMAVRRVDWLVNG